MTPLRIGLVCAVLAVCAMRCPDVLAADTPPWLFGIGTGLSRMNAEGDVGFTSFRGPETADVDLTPKDFEDLTKSALGFSALAMKGPWQFAFTYGYLELWDSSKAELAGGLLPPLKTKFQQEITVARGTATYQFAQTGRHKWGVLGGLHYIEHEYDVKLSAGDLSRRRHIDGDYTDALLGLTHSVPLSPTLTWNNMAAVGVGGSDSYASFTTAVSWQFARAWNTSLFFKYDKVRFQSGNRGDKGWYLYDADEWSPGISIMYLFGPMMRAGQ